MEALDYGFYFDDPQLPVLVAPVVKVETEWRFVVVGKRVVAGCIYEAEGRSESTSSPGKPAWNCAQEIARALPAPEAIYVLDLCESVGGLRLLELNPFSGADLYGCDRKAIVKSVTETVVGARKEGPP